MIYKSRMGVVRCLIHAPLLAAALSVPANANPPTFKPGEVVVYAAANTPQADINALAAKINATAVKNLRLPDCYDFILPATAQDENSTLNAVAVLKGSPQVRWAGTNKYLSFHQATVPASITPNDPLFSTAQWNMQLINMPAAWGVQRGAQNVNVAVIDSGFDSTHPDLQGVFMADSYNFGDGDTNILPDGTDDESQHGTHVSGIIGANTNNSIGVAGIMWTGPNAPNPNGFPQILGLKTAATGVLGTFTETAELEALGYLESHVINDNIKVLSMSFGFNDEAPPDPTAPDYVALLSVYNQGVVEVAAAGNDAADAHTYSPAGYPFVISVSSIGTKKEFASVYSNFGKVEIAAPGGDDPTASVASLMVTSTLAGGYAAIEGTSMACPHVAGVAELLMSMPGMTQAQCIKLLEAGADSSMNKVPGTKDVDYGWGILQADKSLYMASEQASILVGVDANGNPPPTVPVSLPIESYQPRVPIQTVGLPLNRIQITLQSASGGQLESLTADKLNQPQYADLLPNPLDPNSAVQIVSSTIPEYNIVLQPRRINSANGGVYTITVSDPTPPSVLINNASGTTTLDQRTISIQQHVINQYNVDNGPSLVSVPYFGGKNGNAIPLPAELFGTNAIIYRYNAPKASYNVYGGTTLNSAFTTDQNGLSAIASEIPKTEPGLVFQTPAGGQKAMDIRPVGLGFFVVTGTISGSGTVANPSQINVPPVTQDAGNDSIGLSIPTIAEYVPVSDPNVPTQTDAFSAPQTAVDIPLYEGWNIVGDPYPYPVTYNTALVREPTGTEVSIGVAADKGLIAPFIYRRIAGSYQFQTLPAGELAPWEGHWLYVQPKNAASPNTSPVLTLVVPPVPTSTTTTANSKAAVASSTATRSTPLHWVPTAPDGTPEVSGPSSWELQLTAATGSMVDAHNYVGMSQGATNGTDDTKVPKPPVPTPYVTIGMTRQENPGTLYAEDLRPVGGPQQWTLTVKTDQAKSDVAVTWPNIAGVPKSYQVTMTDVTTGAITDLRKNNSYHFTSGTTGGTRSFILIARMAPASTRISLTNIVVNPMRAADGRAETAYEVDYTASQAASVDVSILSSGGRRIATVETTTGTSAGSSRAIWNGKDTTGRQMPAGAYLVEIRAVASDGSMTRQTRPLIISGR